MNNPNKKHKSIRGYFAIFFAVIGVLLVFLTGDFLYQDIASFQSCNVNSSGLSVQNCGKSNVTPGDILMLFIFIGSVTIAYSFLYYSYNFIFNKKKKS